MPSGQFNNFPRTLSLDAHNVTDSPGINPIIVFPVQPSYRDLYFGHVAFCIVQKRHATLDGIGAESIIIDQMAKHIGYTTGDSLLVVAYKVHAASRIANGCLGIGGSPGSDPVPHSLFAIRDEGPTSHAGG